jgi:16S rRNA (cytidine1402-2'-O)-methyltransferase
LSELAEHYDNSETPRGEIVLLIDRNRSEIAATTKADSDDIAGLVERFESEGLDHRAALKKAARELGLSRAEAYRRLVLQRRQ